MMICSVDDQARFQAAQFPGQSLCFSPARPHSKIMGKINARSGKSGQSIYIASAIFGLSSAVPRRCGRQFAPHARSVGADVTLAFPQVVPKANRSRFAAAGKTTVVIGIAIRYHFRGCIGSKTSLRCVN
jgi:hypothetical protein